MKNLKVKFVGSNDWKKMREFMFVKLVEADSEEKLNKFVEVLIASCFRSAKEMDQTRKKLGIKLLEEREKKKINSYLSKR